MKLEFNDYGLCIDSDWFYIALNWKIIILSVVGVTIYKVIKRKRAK